MSAGTGKRWTDGVPTGTVLATGSGDWFAPIQLTPLTIGQGEQYAVVFSTAGDCTIATPTDSVYPPGGAFARNGVGPWQRLAATADVPFRTMMTPMQPFTSLTTWRSGLTATLLDNGKVLLAGGNGGDNTAELYDPATKTSAATGSMSGPRTGHTATLLSNGRVLIAGGYSGTGNALSTAELYDPATGAFTGTGSMAVARIAHTATVLNDGRVLIGGGQSAAGGVASVELYDSAGGQFSTVGNMTSSRWQHTATRLTDGRVLFVGGNSNGPFPVANGEVYDPVSNTSTPTAGPIQFLRARHTATLMADGRVLVAGGTRVYPVQRWCSRAPIIRRRWLAARWSSRAGCKATPSERSRFRRSNPTPQAPASSHRVASPSTARAMRSWTSVRRCWWPAATVRAR